MAKGKRTKANGELFPEAPPGPAPDEAVSAWIKAMRLGDVEAAFYWLALMLEELEVPVGRLARRLGIFGVEDVFDLEVAARLAALALGVRFGMLDANGLWQGTWFACRARKFWESDEGREYEQLSWQALDAVKNGAARPVPSYALDMHTKRGRARRQEGLPVDGRYSGDRAGRAFMVEQYRRLGRLDPEEPGPVQGAAGKVEETEPGVFLVESFTRPGTFYRVDQAAQTCTCPAFEKGKRPCKHLVLVARDLVGDAGPEAVPGPDEEPIA